MFQSTNHSKIAGKTAVKQAAEHLMLSNGGTTTLEVKSLLRQQGYDAYQSDISMWMDRLSYELDWEFSFNGRNRSYRYRLEMDYGLSDDLPAFSLN
ncbi:MAG: hypothetical protein ACI9XO_000649 [Paraglaciecola sp.]|jgi:hypothetical protein